MKNFDSQQAACYSTAAYFLYMEKEEIIKEHLAKLGKKGGAKTLKKHGKKHFSEIAKIGLAKRWNKKKEIPDVDNPT